MAVSKQTYTVSPTWTAAQLATAFEQAFVDAGLMTAWYDSFLNTVENRILEVVYDGTKTYGKTYYWFMFTTGGVYIHTATGWNAVTHVPTGSQYLDYFSTTTSSVTNHATLTTLSSTTSVSITRYTSAINSRYTWFLLRNGTTNANFHIPPAETPIVPWIDLDKVTFVNMLRNTCTVSSSRNQITFPRYGTQTRRTHIVQGALRGVTIASAYNNAFALSTHQYIASGNNNNDSGNYFGTGVGIHVPIGFSNTNPAYTTDSIPVFTQVPYYSFINELLPADLGISFHYANNTMTVQDVLIVSSGLEEWEIINLSNNGTVTTGASALFLARTV